VHVFGNPCYCLAAKLWPCSYASDSFLFWMRKALHAQRPAETNQTTLCPRSKTSLADFHYFSALLSQHSISQMAGDICDDLLRHFTHDIWTMLGTFVMIFCDILHTTSGQSRTPSHSSKLHPLITPPFWSHKHTTTCLWMSAHFYYCLVVDSVALSLSRTYNMAVGSLHTCTTAWW
jgi:hypothetical protein